MKQLMTIPGIGPIAQDSGFISANKCSDGKFEVQKHFAITIIIVLSKY